MSRNNGSVPNSCDVVVIGGGPGGSSAATLLAREGLEVVLLDKARHPRPAVGESIIPHFWKYADLLGVSDKILEDGFLPKAGGIIVWNGRIQQVEFTKFGFTRPGMHVERDLFDDLLLRNSAEQGAQIFEEVAVQRADLADPQAPTVYYSDRRGGKGSHPGRITCKYVVDASGPAAFLARQFNARRLSSSEKKYLGLWGYYLNSNYLGVDRESHCPEEVRQVKPVTFVLAYEDGWAWHIILRESTSVGLVINTDRIRGMGKEAQEAYLQETCARMPYMRDLLEPATFIEGSTFFRPDYSYYSTRVYGDNFFCIGDAASFVDPLFSQGVTAATYNAVLATWAITAGLKHPQRKAAYGKMFERQLYQFYGFSRLLAHGDFGGDGINPDTVQAMMNSMAKQDLELTLAASASTARTENMRRMAREAGVELYDLEKVGYIDELYL